MRPGIRIRAGVVLGLAFLAGPLADLADEPIGAARLAALALGTAAFVVVYVSLLPPSRWLVRLGPRAVPVALALLPVIAGALLAAGAPGSFAGLYVYVVAAAGLLLRARIALAVIAVTALGVGLGAALNDASDATVASLVLTIVAIGAMMCAFGRLLRVNQELREARHELALLAVSEERLRIARDLHDLLGHSLSVIALKSELAARLVERDPARAAAELRDVQSVSRQSLAEVREAVQGYRRLELQDALGSARAALAAAGIEYDLDETAVALPPDVETVLAWTVREGTTNVVRHSDARACAIRVRADGETAAVEVEDDGRAARAGVPAGSGLAGLAERAERVRGRLEASHRPDGGFRLRVTVPLTDR